MPRKTKSVVAAALLATIGAGAFSSGPASAQAEPFIGQIMMVGYNFCPRGWANADGQLLPINQNQALFSLLGTQFGGDGRTNFGLPDLRGRVAMHVGAGPGLSPRREGEKGGSETNTLNLNQLPAHNHSLNATSADGTSSAPAGNLNSGANRERIYGSSAADVQMATGAVGNTGGGQPVNNLQPFLTIRFCVALQGIFPSRN